MNAITQNSTFQIENGEKNTGSWAAPLMLSMAGLLILAGSTFCIYKQRNQRPQISNRKTTSSNWSARCKFWKSMDSNNELDDKVSQALKNWSKI
jgi:hypothetical protein